MTTARIKLKIYARNMASVHDSDPAMTLRLLAWSFGALAVMYVIILGNVVWNIVERKGYESEARALSNEVSNMELTYLSLSQSITQELGASMGFIEAKNTNFATRKSLGALIPAGNEL